MFRQKVLTFVGIALALAIAAGGWMMVGSLIESRSETLISATGSVLAAALQATPAIPMSYAAYENQQSEREDEDNFYEQGLSEQAIVEILRNWDARGSVRPHEPTHEQISMEEALRVGREGLARVGEYLAPEGGFIIIQSRAFLSQNVTAEQSYYFNPLLSYWTVILNGDDHTDISFRINAVTGQIWRIEIRKANFADRISLTVESIDEILTEFTSGLGLTGLDESVFSIETNERGISAYKTFADGNARVVFSATGRQIGDGEWMFFYYSINLTSER